MRGGEMAAAAVAASVASASQLSRAGGVMSGTSLVSPLMLQPLPPVTMVFVAVENPEQLVQRRRPFTPQVGVPARGW